MRTPTAAFITAQVTMMVAWPLPAFSDDHQEAANTAYERIIESFAAYKAQSRTKSLAGCINWSASTPKNMNVQILRSVNTGEGSDRPFTPGRLMRMALDNCKNGRAENNLDCECVPIDRDGKSALKFPESFFE